MTRSSSRRRVSTSGLSSPRMTASASRRARGVKKIARTRTSTTIDVPRATAAPIHWLVATAVTACAPDMGGQGTPRALLLDCLGTLVRLEPPAPRLAAALGVPLAAADAAMRAEIAFYRAHMHEAVDLPALAGLRRRCARVVADALGLAEVPVPVLLGALEFTPFPDA